MEPETSQGTKRHANADIAEPSDKRQKAFDDAAQQQQRRPDPDDTNLRRNNGPSGGILSTLAREIHGPIPVHSDAFITVETENMNTFFSAVRNTLIEMIYPGQPEPADIVTEIDWNYVMRGIVKSRVDHVYANITGLRPNQRIPMPRSFELPKCISDLANSIGFVTILKGGLRVVPQPEVAPQGQDSLSTLFTQARIRNATKLIQAAKVRGIINTGLLSSVNDGTAWWLMSARNPANVNQVAAGVSNVTVLAIFPEWTPSDAMLSAIIQNRYNGLFGDIGAMYWSAGYITSLDAIRASFILGA